ncbi:ribose-phosphate pyrophosphokinase [Listeria grayi FSL F6-1183]|uniref:Ribose-phosphate pyrophosphokinase n=1 Tax=Listeria grayi FSL F6-1183 TaxID=1265827 RepID=A0A829R3X3_LISGR|nr:ribose-phosphate pyrophosphokinase [Listeria grayi FSL F6-1183]
MRLFSVTKDRPLAVKIAKFLDMPLAEVELQKFSDGEVKINIGESVRGTNAYIIQSMNSNVNERLMELLIMIDALKRASLQRSLSLCRIMLLTPRPQSTFARTDHSKIIGKFASNSWSDTPSHR